jgi:hypothetical protein
VAAAAGAAPDDPSEDAVAVVEGPSAARMTFQTAALIVGLIAFVVLATAGVIGLISLRKNPEPVRRLLGKVGDALADWLSTGSGLLLVALALFVLIGYVVAVLGMAAWVSRDAHNRNHTGLGWAVFYLAWQFVFAAAAVPFLALGGLGLIGMAFGWAGLFIYLGGRRPGALVRCRHCRNKRLEYALYCPHCSK